MLTTQARIRNRQADIAAEENHHASEKRIESYAGLLVLQGTNDIRVPKEEAEQVVEILKKNGRTVEWFNKYLKGEPDPSRSSGAQ